MEKIKFSDFVEFIDEMIMEYLGYTKIKEKFNLTGGEISEAFNQLEELVEGKELPIEKPLKMEPVPEPQYGDLMTMQEWISCVEYGGFIDYDGFGQYSDGIQMVNNMDNPLKPSHLKMGRVDMTWSHVVWYNR